MSIPNYGILKGDPASGRVAFDRNGRNPHYRIFMHGGGQIDVNIESQDGSEVLYLINTNFTPPDIDDLVALPMGTRLLPSAPGGLALDYVRETIGGAPMVTRDEMQLLPIPSEGSSNQDQLKNAVIELLDQAVQDPNGTIYAFGQTYTDQGGGIHDIHMNQGNPAGNHDRDNGIWQDGALFINLPASNQWTALFIAFQTQSWQTDNNGDAISA
jgi:uncharacterized protein YukJ